LARAHAEDVETLSARVVVAEALDFEEQEEAVRDAEDLADRVSLVVLDSATGFYRLERTVGDEGEELRRVGRQLTPLLSLAQRHGGCDESGVSSTDVGSCRAASARGPCPLSSHGNDRPPRSVSWRDSPRDARKTCRARRRRYRPLRDRRKRSRKRRRILSYAG